jgi:hypothetical protein
MELVRYKPGEAIRWLETGAESIRKTAKERGIEAVRPDSSRGAARAAGKSIASAAGALVDLGKSAWADLLHRQAEASEYVLQDRHFDVVKPGSIKNVEYERVQKIELRGDRVVLLLDRGHVTIRPYAYIVAGKVRVPIGWSRNGMEVPYELLIDELSARCGVNPEHS